MLKDKIKKKNSIKKGLKKAQANMANPQKPVILVMR
jgi:hypothetical protein